MSSNTKIDGEDMVTTRHQNSEDSMATATASEYKFTSNSEEPQRVRRVQLELVNFTLSLTTQDGNQISFSNPEDVQSILDQARDFNRLSEKQSNGQSLVEIEINLDPLNTVKTFRIPA